MKFKFDSLSIFLFANSDNFSQRELRKANKGKEKAMKEGVQGESQI